MNMDSVTNVADSSVLEGVKNTAVELVNDVSMWSTATSVFVILTIACLFAILCMFIIIKNKNLLIDKCVFRMDEIAGNMTHNSALRNYFGNLTHNKWFAKRYIK